MENYNVLGPPDPPFMPDRPDDYDERQLAQMSADYRAGYEHGCRDHARGDFDLPDSPDPDAPPTSVKRVVGWVRFDGDEYHDFRYQTEDLSSASFHAFVHVGWLPVYVDEPVSDKHKGTSS